MLSTRAITCALMAFAVTLGSATPLALDSDSLNSLTTRDNPLLKAVKSKFSDIKVGDYPGDATHYDEKGGQGVYVDSTNQYKSISDHCWTELWYVESELVPENWVRDSSSIDCANTFECESHRISGTEHCATIHLGSETTAVANIGFLQSLRALGIQLGYTFTYDNETANCATISSNNVCIWNDKKCHTVWRSDLTVNHKGYVRRRCGLRKKDRTIWSKDFIVKDSSSDTRIGCAATCDMDSYPFDKPIPPVGAQPNSPVEPVKVIGPGEVPATPFPTIDGSVTPSDVEVIGAGEIPA